MRKDMGGKHFKNVEIDRSGRDKKSLALQIDSGKKRTPLLPDG
jgi:hypothetical protein